MSLTLRHTLVGQDLSKFTKAELLEALNEHISSSGYSTHHLDKLSKAELLVQAYGICSDLQQQYEVEAAHAAEARVARLACESSDPVTVERNTTLVEGFERLRKETADKLQTRFEQLTGSGVDELVYRVSWDMETIWTQHQVVYNLTRCRNIFDSEKITFDEKIEYLTQLQSELMGVAMGDRTRSTCLLTVIQDDCKRDAANRVAKLIGQILPKMSDVELKFYFHL